MIWMPKGQLRNYLRVLFFFFWTNFAPIESTFHTYPIMGCFSQDLSPLSGSFYLNYEPSHVTSIRDEHHVSKTWSSLVTDHLHHIIAKRKASSISQSQKIFLTG